MKLYLINIHPKGRLPGVIGESLAHNLVTIMSEPNNGSKHPQVYVSKSEAQRTADNMNRVFPFNRYDVVTAEVIQ